MILAVRTGRCAENSARLVSHVLQEFKEVPALQEPLSVADAVGCSELDLYIFKLAVPASLLWRDSEVFLYPQFLQRSRVVVP